jgi:F-actin-capping protein subunit alpha
VAERTRVRVDVRVLIGDDESLETGVLPSLRQYNIEQLTVAEVPGAGHNVGH